MLSVVIVWVTEKLCGYIVCQELCSPIFNNTNLLVSIQFNSITGEREVFIHQRIIMELRVCVPFKTYVINLIYHIPVFFPF